MRLTTQIELERGDEMVILSLSGIFYRGSLSFGEPDWCLEDYNWTPHIPLTMKEHSLLVQAIYDNL